LFNSNNNEIYNNYFNNTNNAYDNGKNTWNDPTGGPNIVGGPYIGGNYWSDYNGTDTSGDMLGDTELPYNCSGGIKNGGDFNPLITIRSYIVTIANNQVGEHYLWGAEGQIPDDDGEVIMARECMGPSIVRPAHHTAQETTAGSHYCSGRHSEVTRLPHGNPDNITHQANYRAYSWERYDWRCTKWVYGEACEGHRHFDCSGLVYFVYNQAGVSLGRTTAAGYAGMDTNIDRTDLKPGDVCYRGRSHIGIYVGGNRITHAAGHDKGVITTPLDNSWNGFGCLLPSELDP
jgi:cell wall-associated NlpC family hydrolase